MIPIPGEGESGKKGPGKKKERPWWARPDHEMIGERVDHFKDIYNDMKIDVDDEDRPSLIREAVKRDPRIENLLDAIPFKLNELERKGDFLIAPVYESDKGKKVAKVLKLRTTRKIKLDDQGWTVWDCIDGERDVREIGRILRERHGDKVEPLYPRLSKFLAYLNTLKLVEIGKKIKK